MADLKKKALIVAEDNFVYINVNIYLTAGRFPTRFYLAFLSVAKSYLLMVSHLR